MDSRRDGQSTKERRAGGGGEGGKKVKSSISRESEVKRPEKTSIRHKRIVWVLASVYTESAGRKRKNKKKKKRRRRGKETKDEKRKEEDEKEEEDASSSSSWKETVVVVVAAQKSEKERRNELPLIRVKWRTGRRTRKAWDRGFSWQRPWRQTPLICWDFFLSSTDTCTRNETSSSLSLFFFFLLLGIIWISSSRYSVPAERVTQPVNECVNLHMSIHSPTLHRVAWWRGEWGSEEKRRKKKKKKSKVNWSWRNLICFVRCRWNLNPSCF